MNAVGEDGVRLSDSEIIEQTLLLLVAGHETTANLISWVLFELASHPEWINKLRQELTQVAPSQLFGFPVCSNGNENYFEPTATSI